MKEEPRNLSAIVDKYLVRRQGEGYSPQTLSTYALHLRLLREDVGDVPMPGISLERLRAHLESFPHLKHSSLGSKVRSIRAFWKWAHEEGYIGVNQMVRIKEPKVPQRVPKHLNVEQLELLRDSCRTEFEHALIELFYATAARIGEMHGMDRAQIDWQQSSILVFGKGSKEREVYFGAKAGIWLKRYLDTRGDDDPALFVTRYQQHGKHQRMSIDRLRFYVKRVAERCGLREKVTPHVLRHTLATHLIDQGMSLAALQSYLGHAKPETTLRYATLSGAARRREFKKYFMQ